MHESASLTISQDPLPMRSDEFGPIYLSAVQAFSVVIDERDGGWKVSTQQYIYRVDTIEQPGEDALFEWHWHPPMRLVPHVHARGQHDAIGQFHRLHLPSARVSFESVARFLIEDLKVRHRLDAWSERLDETEAAFKTYRTWH